MNKFILLFITKYNNRLYRANLSMYRTTFFHYIIIQYVLMKPRQNRFIHFEAISEHTDKQTNSQMYNVMCVIRGILH